MITEIIEGEGISVVTASGKVVVTNTMPNRNTFKTIEIDGQIAVEAKTHSDTMLLSAGPAIKITADPTSNKIVIAVDTCNLTGTFVGDLLGNTVSASTLKISADKTPVKLQQEVLVNKYALLQDDATVIRKHIISLQDQLAHWQQTVDDAANAANIQLQISQQEELLLDIDKQTSKTTASLKLIELSLGDLSATFTYDPFSMVVTSNRTIATPLILQNITTIQRNAIVSPVNGRMIYNTSKDKIQAYAAGRWVDLH